MALVTIMSYPIWTLLCALFFPIIAAIATFVCLRRANSSRRYVGFFVIIPLFVALIVVFLSDTGSIMSDLLASFGLYYPPVVGFLAAIALGIFCLCMIALICGSGLLEARGALTNALATVISLGAEIFILYSAWICRLRLEDVMNDNGIITVGEALPYLSFLPEIISESGIETAALAVLAIYIIIYFLTFIAIRSPEEMIRADLERRRRASLNQKLREEQKHAHPSDDEEELPRTCAFCEHGTVLKGDRIHMVCDSFGVVSSSHTCRKFLYDPLKRTASRPKIEPVTSEDFSASDTDHI